MPISIASPSIATPPWLPLATGKLYSTQISAGGTATLVVTAGLQYAIPFIVINPVTLTLIGIEVTAFATGNVQLGMYADSAGVPGALAFDAGNVSTGTANGFKQIAISQTLAAGLYWLSGIFSATPTVRALTTANSFHQLGFSSGTDTTVHTALTVTQAYGALPNPFTGGSALATINPPRFMVQA